MNRDAFLAKVEEYRKAGWRLALINATTVLPAAGAEDEGCFEIAWGFSLDRPIEGGAAGGAEGFGGADNASRGPKLELIRETVRSGDEVPSISSVFDGAFLYENELRELFGIDVTGIGLDLRGQLYKTATRVPFSHRAVMARLEATGRGAPAAAPHGTAHGAAPATPATPAAPATPEKAPS